MDAAAPQVEFVFAVGPSYFIEIAKLRAARLLWAQAVAAFGARSDDAVRMKLNVRTPRRNKSIFDRYTNLLRVTTEALSAVVGGCDQLTVEPFGFDRSPGAQTCSGCSRRSRTWTRWPTRPAARTTSRR